MSLRSYKAAAVCFQAWLDERGGVGAAEVEQAITQVRRFVEAHGQSRFEDSSKDIGDPRPIYNRAGYRCGSGENEEWLILPETWKMEVCAGLDPTRTARTLAGRNMLVPGKEEFSSVQRVRGRPIRAYVLTARILEGGPDE